MYEQISANKWRSGLLMAFFIAFVVALGYVIGLAWGGTSNPGYAYAGLAVAAVIALVMSLVSYYRSDRVALRVSGAQPVDVYLSDPNWRPLALRFDNAVEGLAIAAGLPKPAAYIIYDEAPNAFATGRNPEHSAIAATTGLLRKMNDQELEGVIAHEMSHVKNYDILVQTMTIVLVGTVILISDIFLRSFWFRDRDSDSGQFGAIMLVVAIAFAILSPLIAQLIKLAIGRRREYLADADGALLTRYPPGLANALRKLQADNRQLRRANKATAHMYIVQPLKTEKGERGRRVNSLFDTHPLIDERIRRLDEMSGSFRETSPTGAPAE